MTHHDQDDQTHHDWVVTCRGTDPAMSSDQRFTVADARRAADADDLGRFVADFLAASGSDNPLLGRKLADEVVSWTGPVRLPFDEIHRLAGPPDQPTLERLDAEDLDTVESMRNSIDDGWEPAPLVVTYDDQLDHLVLEDGNHRVEGLRRAGKDDYWSIVGFRSEAARDAYDERTKGHTLPT